MSPTTPFTLTYDDSGSTAPPGRFFGCLVCAWWFLCIYQFLRFGVTPKNASSRSADHRPRAPDLCPGLSRAWRRLGWRWWLARWLAWRRWSLWVPVLWGRDLSSGLLRLYPTTTNPGLLPASSASNLCTAFTPSPSSRGKAACSASLPVLLL